MKISGLQKTTLLDFPEKIAAIIFVKACNFACPFCFNKDAVLGNGPTLPSATIFSFLNKRKKLLNGLVISGGEPTLQEGLEHFIKKVRKLGYEIKLDTNGSNPEVIRKLTAHKLINYLAIDFKVPLADYAKVIQKDFDTKNLIESIKLGLKAGIPLELRTTIVPGIHDQKILVKMAKEIKSIVGKKKIPWLWQSFQPKNCLDGEFEKVKPYPQAELEGFLKKVQKFYPAAKLRLD